MCQRDSICIIVLPVYISTVSIDVLELDSLLANPAILQGHGAVLFASAVNLEILRVNRLLDFVRRLTPDYSRRCCQPREQNNIRKRGKLQEDIRLLCGSLSVSTAA